MESPKPASNEADDAPKKGPFDNMDQSELIKKCKGLLVIAQKAKQARDAALEEVRALREDIKNFEQQKRSDKECLKTMQEMVDSLTEYKLACTTNIDDLQKKLCSLESKYDSLDKNNKTNEERLSQLDTENVSYKRQVKRLTEENDKLLQDLELSEKNFVDMMNAKQGDLEKQLRSLHEENKILKQDRLKIGEEITAITTEVEVKTEETMGLIKNISSDDNSRNSASLELLKIELTELRNCNSTLATNLNSLQSKYDNLQEELCNKNREIPSICNKSSINEEQKILELQKLLQDKDKENKSLSDELSGYILQVSELNSNITQKEIEQNNILIENENLRDKIKLMEMEYEENNKLIKNLKIELEFQINKLTSEKNEACSKVQKSELETSKHELKNQDLEKRIEDLDKINIENAKKLKVLEKEKASYLKNSKDVHKNLDKIKQENQKHIKLIDELKHQLGDSHNSKRQLEGELDKLRTTLNEFQDAQNSEKDIVINRLESAMEEMKIKMDITVKEVNTMKDNYDKLNNNYEQICSSKEKLISKLKMYHHKLTEFAGNLKQLKSDKNALLETVKDYSGTISGWQAKIAIISSQLCEKLQQCNTESKILQEKVLALEAEQQNYPSQEKTENMQSIEQLENENIRLNEQIKAVNAQQLEFLKTQIVNSENEREKLVATNHDLLTKLQVLSNDNSQMSEEIKRLLEEKLLLEQNTESFNNITSENGSLKNNNASLKLDNERLLKELDEIRSLASTSENLHIEIATLSQQLSNKTTENKELLTEMREINEVLKQRGETISKQQEYCSEMDKKMQSLENEIKQLHYKLDDKDSQLNKSNSQVQKNEHRVKEQASKNVETKNIIVEKDGIIQSLQEELIKLKEKLNNTVSDYQSDTLSTSTISKLEEASRFKDVDSSLEERYSKMRILALKFKKKISEQNSQIASLETEKQKLITEKCDAPTKLSSQAKNLQILQKEYDKLQDELEELKLKNIGLEKSMAFLQDECSQLKLELDATKTKYTKSQNTMELSKIEKSSSDETNKEYKAIIYNLKKSLGEESQNSMLQREEIKKLQEKLASNESQINEYNNNIKSLKDELTECKKEIKRKSLLNLEMDNYEKTLNDISKKLEQRNKKIQELESEISTNSVTINTLNEQVKVLKDELETEVSHSKDLKERLNTIQLTLNESEHQNSIKQNEISGLKNNIETLTAKIEELGIELMKSVAEKEISITNNKSEKDSLLRQTYDMENTITTLTENLNKCKSELVDIKTEFSSYKIRAQSVLRQNQFKDISKEDELLEEIKLLTLNKEDLTKESEAKSKQLEVLNKELKALQEEKNNYVTRCNELLTMLDNIRLQHDSLMEENQKLNIEHQEAIKAQKLQNDTLINCYKQQVTELQDQYSKQLNLSKTQIEQTNIKQKLVRESYVNEQKLSDRSFIANQDENINITLMERGDGEGSESTHSTSPTNVLQRRRSQTHTRSSRDIIPLDELLNTTFLDNNTNDPTEYEGRLSPTSELQNVKQTLNVEQCRVKHLSGLLAENEQDLAKLTQLNEVLKEEIRRSQRSLEREKHTQNSEYLKNVIFKFVTLNSGDEKTHLVPVLNMLLKLSPDETQKLQDIAKGIDSSSSGGWGTYLPRWSNQQ